ncbi:MAG: hypothetical protein M3Y59_01510 [Myxococcota bacterium]|nr:hypothetical protein [Myxococcota bacterium]
MIHRGPAALLWAVALWLGPGSVLATDGGVTEEPVPQEERPLSAADQELIDHLELLESLEAVEELELLLELGGEGT